MTRPTSNKPLWATAAAAGDVVEPPSARRAAGYNVRGEPPARQHYNWQHRTIGEWIDWLDGDGFAAVGELIENLPAGRVGLVKGQGVPWSEAWTHLHPGDDPMVAALACSGREVLALVTSTAPSAYTRLYCHEPDDGSVRWQADVGGVGPCTDGVRVFAVDAAYTSVKVFDREDGTLLDTMALGGADIVYGLATDGTYLYVARNAAVSGGSLRAYSLETLSTVPVWEVTAALGPPDDDIRDIATDGTIVAVAKSTPTGGEVAVYDAATGARLGATSTPAPVVAVCTDGERIWGATSASLYLMTHDGIDAAAAALELRAVGALSLASDGQRILVAQNEHVPGAAYCAVVGPEGQPRRSFELEALAAAADPARAVATDGGLLYAGQKLGNAGITLRAIRLPTRPRWWRRLEITDRFRPIPGLLAVPES